MKQRSSRRAALRFRATLFTVTLWALAGLTGWSQSAGIPGQSPGSSSTNETGLSPTRARQNARIASRTSILEGSVKTDTGAVISSGVIVRLATLNGQIVDEQTATSGGTFQFSALQGGSYSLTVSARGFQTLQEFVDVEPSSNVTHVDVRLEAKGGKNLLSEKVPALSDRGASRKARKEYEKGVRSLRNGEMSEAQLHFEKAVEIYPCYARAQAQLGSALAAQNNQLRAEAALRKAISCDHDFLLSYVLLGGLYNAERRFTDSVTVLKEGVRRAPSAWQFFYHLAVAHFGLGQYRTAEEEYLKVRSLNPAPPSSLHVELAAVYLRESADRKAYAELQAYLRAEPDGPLAPRVKEAMRRLDAAGATPSAQANTAASPPAKP